MGELGRSVEGGAGDDGGVDLGAGCPAGGFDDWVGGGI